MYEESSNEMKDRGPESDDKMNISQMYTTN